MTSSRLNAAAVILLPLLLAACAGETQWAKSGADAAQMFRDLAQCREFASIQAEREYQLDRQTLRGAPIDEQRDAFRDRMMAFQATKHRDKLIERCMIERGYQKTTTP